MCIAHLHAPPTFSLPLPLLSPPSLSFPPLSYLSISLPCPSLHLFSLLHLSSSLSLSPSSSFLSSSSLSYLHLHCIFFSSLSLLPLFSHLTLTHHCFCINLQVLSLKPVLPVLFMCIKVYQTSVLLFTCNLSATPLSRHTPLFLFLYTLCKRVLEQVHTISRT